MKKYISKRNEKQMLELIIEKGKKDDRILAIYMNGSRTNNKIKKDQYQDYDIVYVVRETKSIIEDSSFLLDFGIIAIKQEPDLIDSQLKKTSADFSKHYTWLILFKDGNRIDLTIETLDEAIINIHRSKLTLILFDKNNYLPKIDKPTDIDYLPKKPSEIEFNSTCNEFFWCLNNVAKGIARNEIPYAMEMFNKYVRDALNKMLNYYVGLLYEYKVSPGKLGKFYKDTLPKKYYKMYLKTYSNAKIPNIWKSIFIAIKLFNIVKIELANKLNLTFNANEDINTIAYLKNIKNSLYKEN